MSTCCGVNSSMQLVFVNASRSEDLVSTSMAVLLWDLPLCLLAYLFDTTLLRFAVVDDHTPEFLDQGLCFVVESLYFC